VILTDTFVCVRYSTAGWKTLNMELLICRQRFIFYVFCCNVYDLAVPNSSAIGSLVITIALKG